ncbi:MAG: PQQ-dependent sugar dehydrogenase [Chitinophagaceae bacterium]|nr:PQQ-dependent sugar dehydrogenase [Chitinophagaceae bacterium]
MKFTEDATPLQQSARRVRRLLSVFIFLSVFALSFIGVDLPEPYAPGVVIDLQFNEGAGTVAADFSGNVHNGTLTNGPTWGAGKYGQGVNLDGTNDYVNIADHANLTLDPVVNYTWSGWIRNNNFNEWGTVWSQTLNATNFFYFYAHTTSDPEGGPVTNGISLYWWSNNGTRKLGLHSNNNVLTVGQWSYVAITYNAALAQASRFTIYVNGVDVTNRTDVASVGVLGIVNPTSARIGSNQPFGEYFNGSIDEFRYYRRMLSQAEVQSDMLIGNAPDSQAPTTNITAPAAGNVSGTINVTANANDNVGVVGVQFLLDGVNLGAEDLAAPYSVSWNTTTATNGNHNLTVRARDAAGNSTVSAAVAVNVSNDSQAPTVAITAPAAGNVSATVDITANAADNVGVSGVQFLLNGANLGTEDLTAPYSTSWNTSVVSNGNYTLTARARDAAGNITTSTGVLVTVNNTDGTPPTVNLTAPAAGNVAGTINITANAADNLGVSGVQFQLNGANLGAEDLSAPYSVSWNTLTSANGNYILTAIARDGAGNTTTSPGVVVTVNNDLQGPMVSITAPAAGSVSGSINVTANATDNVGVSGVQFLLNGANLGTEDVAAPYSISWNTLTSANGSYTVTARARDAAGNTTTSLGVVVNVSNTAALPFAAYPMNEGLGTAFADISGNAHNGTLTNGPTWIAGKYGQGVNLDGIDDFMTVADHANFTLDPAQGYTWSGWIRNTNFREWSTVWSQTLDRNNFFYFYAHTTSDPDGGPVTNGISLYWWGSGGTNKVGVHSTNNVLTAAVWSHVAVTYDGGQVQNNRFTIYVNGVDVTNRTDVSSTGTLPTINPTNTRIGANAPFGEYLTGSVDEFRFYRRALTLPEITSDMNTALGIDATNPTVLINAPAAGVVSSTVNISAIATDNVGVAGVQFVVNGINQDVEDVTSPYSITWNTTAVSNGSYTLTARVRDAAGNTATSAPVIVTVNNIPDETAPIVNLTSPVGGNVTGTINVTADATDNIGVVGVQFLLNGTNLGVEDITAPYSVSWNTLAASNGDDTLTARARDAAGNIKTSIEVIVNVNNDLLGPVVSITSPVPGVVAGELDVAADASDNVGVAGVQFLLNGTNLGAEDASAPYSVSWNTVPIANGNYTLTARARDAAGNSTTSVGVIVTVNNLDEIPPTVNITAPAAGNVSGTINVTANAADNLGVAGVQFQLNGANLGSEDVTAPYSLSWNTLTSSNGSYTITAIARDGAGNTTTSAGVIVAVNNDLEGPTITITAPVPGTVSGTVNVTANATDNIGVSGVQFLLNGANLGAEDVVAPYGVSWNTISNPNGSYTLTARARDAAGNITTSASVLVNVSNANNFTAAYPMNEGTGTAAADISGNGHHAALTNAPTWTAGKYGQAVNLDGANDFMNIPDHANFTLDPAQSYTWSGWLKNTNFLQWSTVWSQTIDGNNFFYFYAHTTNDPDGGPVTNGVSVYWWGNGGTNKVGVHSNNNVLTIGLWSHIAVTYNAAQPQNNRFTIYVNGVDVTNRADVSSTGTLSSIDPTNIRIGSNAPFGEYLTAAVDEFRYYRRLLSLAEVVVDMNTPLGEAAVDNTAPVVSITAPVAGSVSGIIDVTANATDNIAVTGVQFLLDGVNLGTEDLTSPYSVQWNTTTATGGSHVLTARARDNAGNTTTSSPVNVIITPDFTFTLLNSTRDVETTGSTNFGVSINYLNGFTSSNVVLSVTGLPAGVTGNYAINPMTNQGQTQLLISANDANPGVYTLTLTATAGSLIHSQEATLIVNSPDDFELSASPSVQNVAVGSGTSYFININESGDFTNPVALSIIGLPAGMTASFNPAFGIPPTIAVLTVTTQGSTPIGTYNFTVQGASGGIIHTLPLSLTVLASPPAAWPETALGSGWNTPVGATFSKDGQKLFVWEKGGKVFVCNRNPATQLYDKQSTPVLDISAEVGDWFDMGFLGLVLDPAFETNGLIYVSYIVDRHHLLNFGTPAYEPAPPDNVSAQKATIGRVTRYQTVSNAGILTANLATRTVLLGETKSTGVPILFDSHGMGSLHFAADGTLIVSAGDGASYNTIDGGNIPETYYVQALADGIIRPNENVGAFRAQMLNSLNGKILRISPVDGNGIPSNPFYDPAQPRSPRSRVWALGLRNPYRFSIRPGTGSTNPAAGDIGEIYVGDVGFGTWEELTVVKQPGMNCGWPLYEGHTPVPFYHDLITANRDEPNPLFNVGGCSQQFFTFQNLLKQATADNIETVFNPCNVSLPIGTGNRYFHRRPLVDTRHDADVARVGIFNGNTAAVATIGTPASGVVGTPYRGNCVIAGFWYTGNLFPVNYRNTFFYGDFGRSWIKTLTVNFTDVLQKVEDFAVAPNVVCMVENPLDGTLVYIDVYNNTVKRISYGGNQFPVVKMSSNVTFGPAPLSVSFTGNNSFDPEGGRLTYSWNFGDGTPVSTAPNPPIHNFAAPLGVPTRYVVRLTVRDSVNAVATDSIIISVNNTPPVVNITSPIKNSTYNVGSDSIYLFRATVTDVEHTAGQLKYEWQQVLKHDEHEHPGPIDTVRNTFGSIARIGCNGDDYSWLVRLKVTDAAGLWTKDSSHIFPNCSSLRMSLVLKEFSVTQESNENLVRWLTDLTTQVRSFNVERSSDGINFYSINHQTPQRATAPKEYGFKDKDFVAGANYYRLKIVDIGGVARYSVTVKTFAATSVGNLTIFPNPAAGDFALRYTAAESGTFLIRISDIDGKQIHNTYETVKKGENIINLLARPGWKTGMYMISVHHRDGVQRAKLVYTGNNRQ